MKNIKIYPSILIATTLALTLSGCTPKPNEVKKEETTLEIETTTTNLWEEESSTLSQQQEQTEATSSTKETDSQELETFDNFNSEVKELQDYQEQEQLDQFKSRSKEIFVNGVDFLFEDKEYKGITFDELKDKAKEQTLDNLQIIGSWVEKIDPNYEQQLTTIKDFARKAKDKGFAIAKDILGEDTYHAIGNTKEKIIEKSQEATGKVKEKINDWYQNFKK